MFLKGVEIAGFKSFCEKVYIEFQGGITSIVGPNGSGKSNIMDAVLWVLGEQSYKNIRAKDSSDVIFNGNGKVADFAKVSLYIDNSDDFLTSMGDTVKISRKLNKKGDNEYYINDKRARLKDIGGVFLDTGIGKSAYSVIGQGKVERIISSSNKEIKQIIEEAAGIKKFQLSRNDSLKNLNSLSDELEKILLVKNEVEKNRNHIEKQASKAKEYLELKKEKESFEKDILNFDQREKSEKLNSSRNHKDNLEIDIKNLEENISNNENEFQSNEEKRSETILKIEEISQLSRELKEKIEEDKREFSRVEERSASFSRELALLVSEEKSTTGKLEMQREYLKSIETNYNNVLQTLKELEEKNRVSSNEIKVEEDSRQLFEVQHEIKKRKLMDLEVERLRMSSEIETQERRIKSSENKVENLKKEINLAKEKCDASKKQLEVLEKKLESDEKKVKEVEKRVGELEKESATISSENNRLTGLIRNKEYEEKRSLARLNSILAIEDSNEGLFKGVKEVLNAKLAGVCGIVANLISIPNGLEKAIEAAIPGNLQDIVVEDASVAKKGVEILREKKVGRASFLALDTIKVNSSKKNISGKGIVGIASTLITSDEKYSKVVEFLLGNLLIVENMEIGLEVIKKESHSGNVVTLSGELLSSRGRITGGENQNSALSAILERKREKKNLEVTLSELKEELSTLNRELSVVREKLDKLEDEILNIDTLIENSKKEYKNTKDARNEKSSEVSRLERDILILTGELEEENNYIQEFRKRATTSTSEKESKEEEIKSINMELQKLSLDIGEADKKIESLKEAYSDIRIKYLNSENRKSALVLEKERGLEEEKVILEELENKKNKISEYQGAINKANLKLEELKSSIEMLDLKFSSENKEIIKLKEEINLLSEKEKKLISSRRELDITLFKKSDQLKKVIEEVQKLSDEVEKITSELSLLESVEIVEREITIEEKRKIYKTLDSKFRNFETVNLLAIEEFLELDLKYNNLNRQYVDMDESRKRLLLVIEEISKEIESRFSEAYTSIDRNFNELCMDILHNSEGKLQLTEGTTLEESGVDIVVKYKNKREQSLSLFSGGEKSMVAIAFVMAIFMYKPSPFTFLDEIEAALDDKNTRKLIGKLKEFTDRSQFILITHNKETMRESDSIFGVTMNKEVGISKIVPVKF